MKKKEPVVRFGVSMEKRLVAALDHWIREHRYPTRSEALRDLVQEALVEEQWCEGKEIAAGIVLVYDHDKPRLVKKLLDIQHRFHHAILSSQHIHLDRHLCLEVVVARGKAEKVKQLYYALKGTKGLVHTGLLQTTVSQATK